MKNIFKALTPDKFPASRQIPVDKKINLLLTLFGEVLCDSIQGALVVS